MALPDEDILEGYKSSLEELRANDKFRINALTYTARDNKDNAVVAKGIVELTRKHIEKIQPNLKLVGLYVIDSIIKNVGKPYKELFSEHIVDVFVHSFQAIRDETIRVKLYNLRTTWKEIFPNKRLYDLDMKVRQNDPAWPLVAKPPDSQANAASSNSGAPPAPSTKPESVEKCDKLTMELPGKVGTATEKPIPNEVNEHRDPRLNRKRKKDNDLSEDSADSPDFVIDKSGDNTIERNARKQGMEESKMRKRQASTDGSPDSLVQRGQKMPPPSSPSLLLTSPRGGGVWSHYRDNHNELIARRMSSTDVDMRYDGPSSHEIAASSLPQQEQSPAVLLEHVKERIKSGDLTSDQRQQLMTCLAELRTLQTERINPQLALPLPLAAAPAPVLLRTPQIGPPLHPVPFQPPPPRGPMWKVEIEGYPDPLNIGVDPRLLCFCGVRQPHKQIMVDGRPYPLILDRLQPLVGVNNHLHAIRFRCDSVTIMIDGLWFNLPGVGFARVCVGRRYYNACLGGPGHELIIDGKSHCIPFDGSILYIGIGNQMVPVSFRGPAPKEVNILPPIPIHILRWAWHGMFGSPRTLYIPPLNPQEQLMHQAMSPQLRQPGPGQRFLPPQFHPINQKVPIIQPPLRLPVPVEVPVAVLPEPPAPPAPTPAPPPLVNVHELWSQLVEKGIIVPPPDLHRYTHDKFKQVPETSIAMLYRGHQCAQCGLRFENETNEEFTKHMDYHYVKNSAEQMDNRCRNFYQSSRHWLISEQSQEAAPHFDDGESVANVQDFKCPAFKDDALNVCAVCLEKFEQFYEDEEEEWMLRDAVLSDGKAYHPICREDAGKEFQLAAAEAPPSDDNDVSMEPEPAVDAAADVVGLKQEVKEEAEQKETVPPDSRATELPLNLVENPHAALELVLRGGMASVLAPAAQPDNGTPGPRPSSPHSQPASPSLTTDVNSSSSVDSARSSGTEQQMSPLAALKATLTRVASLPTLNSSTAVVK